MGKKKEKITYIDDDRTIADMSGVRGGLPKSSRNPYTPRASFKEQWQTYWSVVKLMLRPMLVVVVGILVIYALTYLLFSVI
ncbi:MAG: hypothetical protein ACI3W5_11545 [Faecousia sp.]